MADQSPYDLGGAFPLDLQGIGGWMGARMGLEGIVQQRAAQAALERKQQQEDLANQIKMMDTIRPFLEMQEKRREYDAGDEGRKTAIALQLAQANEIEGKPQAARDKTMADIYLEQIRAGNAADAAEALRVANEKQKQLDRENAVRVAEIRGKAGAGGSGHVQFEQVGGKGYIFNPATGEIRAANDPANPGQQLVGQTADMRNQAFSRQRAVPILQNIAALADRIDTAQGLVAKFAGTAQGIAAKAQMDDDVNLYNSLIDSFTPIVARALGHTGVLTEQDVQSARKILPALGESKSLKDRKIETAGALFEDIGSKGAEQAMVNPGQPASVGGARTGAAAAATAPDSAGWAAEDLANARVGAYVEYPDGTAYEKTGAGIKPVPPRKKR